MKELKLAELLTELRGCMKAADECYGMHKEVIEDSIWGRDYLRMIKNGTVPADTIENHVEILTLIKHYELLLSNHVRSIKGVVEKRELKNLLKEYDERVKMLRGKIDVVL